MLIPLSAVVFASLALADPQGGPGAGQTQAPEAAVVQREDLIEVFALLLKDSGYDGNRKDQKKWDKPERLDTKHLIKDDDKSFRVFGFSPGVALAANTGINNAGNNKEAAASSIVFMHLPSLQKIARSNRGILAFILAHEFRHLINHDPENLEKHNLDHFNAWCEKNQKVCDSEQALAVYTPLGDEARAKFLKPFEDRADMEARKWLKKLVDPKTSKPFGEAAAEEAMVALKRWLKETGRSEAATGQHAGLEERLKKFQAARLADKKRAAEIEARAGRVQLQVKF